MKEKEWEGEYTPWAGNTKHAHAHLTFDDGPIVGDTDTILDILKEYDTKATFFIQTNKINDETDYLVTRMIDEGHMIGSHTTSHRNLQYMNETLLMEEIVEAHHFFANKFGEPLKLFRPPFGGIDHRSHKMLEDLGYSIIMWSAGCVDWWFTDNDKDLETSIAAMRFSLAEAGGIVCMHDSSEAPNDGERLRKFLDDTWNFWQYVDFNTCIDRDDVDEGMVFKTYNEFKRAVDIEAARMEGESAEPESPVASPVSSSGDSAVFVKSSKSAKSSKSKSGKSKAKTFK